MATKSFQRACYRLVCNGQAFIIYRAGNAYSRWCVFADHGEKRGPLLAKAGSESGARDHAFILAGQGKGAAA